MINFIRKILIKLKDCKWLKKSQNEIWKKIRIGIKNAKKIKNSMNLQQQYDNIQSKYKNHQNPTKKKETEKFIKDYSHSLPKLIKRQVGKTIHIIKKN